MKNKTLLFSLCILTLPIFSQKKITGTVVDKNTAEPIEFVDVFNGSDYTMTNEEGKFDFITKNDSITFNFLGYKKIKTTINQLNSDSLVVYLEPKTFDLNEVVVSNKNTAFHKMVKTIKNDFSPNDFDEEFFLRTILKRNDSIIKIQDLNGIINRKVLFSTTENPITKKNYKVYINHMRKAAYDKDDVYFKLLGFNELLTNLVRVAISTNDFIINKSFLKEDSLIKLRFKPKTNIGTNGYYILNSDDYSLNKVHYKDSIKQDYTIKKNIKYKTIYNELLVTFYKKETAIGKYRIDNAKLKYTVECYYKNTPISYDVTYIYKTSKDPVQNFNKKNKVSDRRDIFKIKHPFNKNYWSKNQQLKLTTEMLDFLKELENSTSKTITNFKN